MRLKPHSEIELLIVDQWKLLPVTLGVTLPL